MDETADEMAIRNSQVAPSVEHIASEYNNLLTAIIGYSEAVLERLDGEDGNRPFLEEIRDAGVRAAKLTQRLEALGKLAGKPIAETERARATFTGEPGQAAHGVGAAPNKGRQTVLVVEDEESVRALVCGALSAEGYAVLEAGGAREAMYVHENHAGSIDVLLTDVVLPGKNGLEIAKEFSDLRPEIRVIIMSGYADPVVRNGLERNCSAFLRKPFSLDLLLKSVRYALDSAPIPAESEI